MILDSFASLEILTVAFELRVCQPVSLPSFLGTTLRGAFGQSLKLVACRLGIANCSNYCTYEDFCPYDYLFETASKSAAKRLQKQADTPNPYIVVPPPLQGTETLKKFVEGDKLVFGIKLIGKACYYLPYIINSVKDMCKTGLTVKRIPFKSLIESRLTSFNDPKELKIELLTPLRLRTGRDFYVGMNDENQLTFELLIKNLIRRFSLLEQFHGDELSLKETELFDKLLKEASSVTLTNDNTYWFDTERYSNRQKARLRIGGLMGSISFRGENLRKFLPVLLLGEHLNIGTSTAFGLGQLKISV
ncbi:MAG: CRISPR system precrRNA processing endoribonuclease RAMP protein Cas6 [Blastocatellia bacterium]|nr:CRISPR system precrRNA processing endoribonuclease RAMP protein Cas6 [Blastocatellia bacterium]